MSNPWLFSFAAKSLQSYIMRGGKLRDMVGATSLVDKLSDETLLTERLETTFGVKGNIKILQAAAGSARIEFADKKEAHAVHSAWPLWCRAWAPDLEVVQHLCEMSGSYADTSKATSDALEQARNFPSARLPEAGPWVKRAPRTGEPAVKLERDGDQEIIDEASRRKRAERDSLNSTKKMPPIAKVFQFSTSDEIPKEFAQVSGDERAYLAVVHADGNRLGQMFIDVAKALKSAPATKDENAKDLLKHLSSEVVAEGTRAAVKRTMIALRKHVQEKRDAETEQRAAQGKPLKPEEPWPFAPIVLAGDDVTIVCRADLGIPFAEAFLGVFRDEMRDRLKEMRKTNFWEALGEHLEAAVPNELTAGAGIVFCSHHYPFSLAYELCESLAKQAKNTAKAGLKDDETPASALSFLRITGASAPTDFDDLARGILHGADGTLLTGCPYYIDGERAPQLKHLRTVAKAARSRKENHEDGNEQRVGMPSSTLRELLHLQQTDYASVEGAVQRMLDVVPDKSEHTKDFITAWTALTGYSAHADLPDWHHLRFFDLAKGQRSPLLDVLTLHAVKCADKLTTTPAAP